MSDRNFRRRALLKSSGIGLGALLSGPAVSTISAEEDGVEPTHSHHDNVLIDDSIWIYGERAERQYEGTIWYEFEARTGDAKVDLYFLDEDEIRGPREPDGTYYIDEGDTETGYRYSLKDDVAVYSEDVNGSPELVDVKITEFD